MAPDSLYALPPFLRFLTAFPEPDAVAEALSQGPLVGLQPIGLSLFERKPAHGGSEQLVLLGSHAAFDDVVDRYARLPLSLNLPITEAVAQSRVVVNATDRMVLDYRPLQLDADLWRGITESSGLGRGSAVSAPIAARGHSIGAFTFLTARRPRIDSEESRLLDILGHVLGLWLAERQAATRATGRRAPQAELALTARQEQVLLLIEQGKGNDSIAAALGYSRSTVKVDIRQMMVALRCESRQQLVERARELSLLPERRPRAV